MHDPTVVEKYEVVGRGVGDDDVMRNQRKSLKVKCPSEKDSERGKGRRTSRLASEVSSNEIGPPAKVERGKRIYKKQKIVCIIKSRKERTKVDWREMEER